MNENLSKFLTKNNIKKYKSTYKDNVLEIEYKGLNCFLKYDKNLETQVYLTKKANELNIFFKVPKIMSYENDFLITEKIGENSIKNKLNLNYYLDITYNISDSYQQLLKESKDYLSKVKQSNQEIKAWSEQKLKQWSKTLIDQKIIEKEKIENIIDFIKQNSNSKNIGFVHGNIHGDHILLKGKQIYLIDLEAVQRIFYTRYDFHRSLDWAMIKYDIKNTDIDISKISKNNLYCLAFRMIGGLGWDILHNGDKGSGSIENKIKFFKNIIKKIK